YGWRLASGSEQARYKRGSAAIAAREGARLLPSNRLGKHRSGSTLPGAERQAQVVKPLRAISGFPSGHTVRQLDYFISICKTREIKVHFKADLYAVDLK